MFLRGSFGEGFANSFWRGIRLQRRRGKKKTIRSRKVFSGAGCGAGIPRQGSTGKTSQNKPREAKGSLQGQMTFSESGWRLAEAININLGDPVRVQISLGPHYICPRMEFPR